ncbi:sigma-70 family RNA polymerase sigma factor [Nonomuraea sp. NPDC049784]|uniref:sigma-70 family RNA polymerase sigma factor n=1 Tax=Nonomuraea sp. NPDC049784 TaxID=3154361 RepID=UPI00340C6241
MLAWMRTLSPPVRATIALRVDGYSVEETALLLDIPQRLVHRRLAQGREILRAAFLNQMTVEASNADAEQFRWDLVEHGPPTSMSRPSQPVVNSSEERAAYQALADLPPRQKQVLQLSRQGYMPAQIARLLRLSANTVRVNLHHARKRMQRNLDRLAIQAALGAYELATGRA